MDWVAQAGIARWMRAVALMGLAWLGCSDSHSGSPAHEGGSGSGAAATGQPKAGGPSDAKPPPQGGSNGSQSQPQPAGNSSEPTPGQSVRFNARLEGDELVVDIKRTGIDRLHYMTCTQRVMLEKLVNDEFVPVRDDRPVPNVRPGYYLDGEFIPGGVDSCSVMQCVPYADDRIEVGPVYEYVQLGVMPVPGGDASLPQVPVIERRPLSGLIRITLTYFEDAMCQVLSGITFEHMLPGPDGGVCCPIGPEQCSSSGPGGGWAPSLDECPPFQMEWDTLFVHRDDAHGCPKLVPNYEYCCNCAHDDAGL